MRASRPLSPTGLVGPPPPSVFADTPPHLNVDPDDITIWVMLADGRWYGFTRWRYGGYRHDGKEISLDGFVGHHDLWGTVVVPVEEIKAWCFPPDKEPEDA